MITIIAEKPSVAREIAKVLGVSNRADGYLEGKGYYVTWALGHLVGLALPEVYGFRGFRADHLPIIPKPFRLTPRQVRGKSGYSDEPGAKKQLKVIKGLFDKSSQIVVATDAGREGELIFRYIYNYLECNLPFKRLWISSLTEKAIRKGLSNLKDGYEFNNLYQSARARSEADWLVGINSSQALTATIGQGVYSLGRVQTPTLSLICKRYNENISFTAQTYYQIRLHTAKDATLFSALSVERYSSRADAEKAIRDIESAKDIEVLSVESRRVNEQPPLLYDLTTLQREANAKHGFTAEQTLNIAQKLYEKGYITYPRTGSRYISDDLFEQTPALLNAHLKDRIFSKTLSSLLESEINRRCVDNTKITDHHAILATDKSATQLSKEEEILYRMIFSRLVESLSGVCIKIATSVKLSCSKIEFSAKGTVPVELGWRAVMRERDEQKEEDHTVLPELAEGDRLMVKGCDVLEKRTKPKPLYSEGTLLAAMESAGRELEDKEHRDAIKECGIGTPATRAAVIETLFRRDYIVRDKKNLLPTEKGLTVYNTVQNMRIADVEMTADWELALSKIESGEMPVDTFYKGIEIYASQITREILNAKIVGHENSPLQESCPKCREQTLREYPKVIKCRGGDCDFTLYKSVAGKELTDIQIKSLLTKGHTAKIKGLRGRSGKLFSAALWLTDDYKTAFSFDKPNKGK